MSSVILKVSNKKREKALEMPKKKYRPSKIRNIKKVIEMRLKNIFSLPFLVYEGEVFKRYSKKSFAIFLKSCKLFAFLM